MSLQSHLQKSTYRLLKKVAAKHKRETGIDLTDKEIMDRALKCYAQAEWGFTK